MAMLPETPRYLIKRNKYEKVRPNGCSRIAYDVVRERC